MNAHLGWLWTMLLILLVTLLFAASMLPALIEHRWPKDIAPLNVVRDYDGNAVNFAIKFSEFVEAKLGDLLRGLPQGAVQQGRLPSGEPYLLLGDQAVFTLADEERGKTAVDRIVAASGSLALPEDYLFAGEVFACGDFLCGRLSACRAVLCEGNGRLERECVILRWIHACGTLAIGEASQLYGRASSDISIELADEVKFERLHAPKIVFGKLADDEYQSGYLNLPVTPWQPDGEFRLAGNQWRVDGDVTMPACSACDVPLAVGGRLLIGEQSRFAHALKSNADMRIGKDCRIDDAIVAATCVEVGAGSYVKGPVISEAEVILRKGCVIGSPDKPTTISAPRVVVERGVIVHGSIWARERGQVRMQA